MANTFALILALGTLITGIVWCLDKFIWAPARNIKVEAARVNSEGQVDGQTLAKLGRAPAWIESLSSFFPILAVVFFVRSFVYEPFQIPSGSMMPTLLIGDFILVEKYAYGIKDPITQTTLIPTGTPKRGDIVVFKYPGDTRLDYIKRMVGLPGDTVTYDPVVKVLSIKPACAAGVTDCPPMAELSYGDVEESAFVMGFEQVSRGFLSRFHQVADDQVDILNLISPIRMLQRSEVLGDQAHNILLVPNTRDMSSRFYQQPGQPVATWVVPEGYYFAMGDNRDNSEDSRFWGFIPERNLVGKAVFIWMSFEKQESEWPSGVRFDRIGRIR